MGKKKAGHGEGDQAPAQPQNGNGSDRKPPLFELRAGRIKVVCWANLTTDGEEWMSFTLGRIYSEGDKIKTASSFGRDDLLPLARLLEHAWASAITRQGGRVTDTGKPSDDVPI